ncbi:Hypothetical predicted protein [Olea europaea subsp. europaea]|uniref:Uncharacterized protein n=1 Tax=Olea europaea subsp. europaea TaxID=158383 RepID=A0A8S0T622_OLEEU|nr:Hypothetical predicted protein [Olea europaea subsp. europaea]
MIQLRLRNETLLFLWNQNTTQTSGYNDAKFHDQLQNYLTNAWSHLEHSDLQFL